MGNEVDIWCRLLRVAVAAKIIGPAGIDTDKDNVTDFFGGGINVPVNYPTRYQYGCNKQ